MGKLIFATMFGLLLLLGHMFLSPGVATHHHPASSVSKADRGSEHVASCRF